MTKTDITVNEDDERSVWYYLVKYTVFLTPPVAIFLTLYFFTNDLLVTILGTLVILVLGIISIALWYINKNETGVVLEKK